jgi:hypothetical protein
MQYQFKEEDSRIVVQNAQGNEAGEITFSRTGENILIIDHTGVEEPHRGQGLAEELVRHAVDKAKSENIKIIPLCPFAKMEFDRKPEYRDVQHT